MKYLDEYRNTHAVKALLKELHQITKRSWSIMEICGGQTHSLVKNGIINMLPKEITMVHGPGCPVCVTPLHMIDKAIYLASVKGVTLFSFGDMMRVPGSRKSMLTAKAEGADIRIVYSPLEAVKFAKENSEKEVVFFAVGFETTAPANALSVIQAHKNQLKNFSILTSHVLVPPAMDAILGDVDNTIQGFLAAGHVCTIMGTSEYVPLAKKYNTPIVITGFEPVDLLQGIVMVVKQLEEGRCEVENQYTRVVNEQGNESAQETIDKVFYVVDREWRGIGMIPDSGFGVRPEFSQYDADNKFEFSIQKATESPDCIAGDILKGRKKPFECPAFGKLCNPENPLGAPMVSSEGACAAYYHFSFSQEIHA